MHEEDFWNILKINLSSFYRKPLQKTALKVLNKFGSEIVQQNLFQLVSLPQLRPVPRHLFYFYVVFIVAIFKHYGMPLNVLLVNFFLWEWSRVVKE